jgi:protein-S-isoprenylcysteine O-methyltransferase Ste14
MAQRAIQSVRFDSLRDYTWHIFSSIIPMILFASFCYIHVRYWVGHGELKGLGFAIQEAVLVFLFLVRRRPVESINSFAAWSVAIAGAYGVLLLQPNDNTLLNLDSFYTIIALLGAALAITSTAFLGRSFGLVAANRGVKSDGAYRIVRHPIYASYLVGFSAYLLASLSLWNVIVLVVSMGFQLRRIYAEESVLMRDPEYQAYAQRTRHRLVPGIY